MDHGYISHWKCRVILGDSEGSLKLWDLSMICHGEITGKSLMRIACGTLVFDLVLSEKIVSWTELLDKMKHVSYDCSKLFPLEVRLLNDSLHHNASQECLFATQKGWKGAGLYTCPWNCLCVCHLAIEISNYCQTFAGAVHGVDMSEKYQKVRSSPQSRLEFVFSCWAGAHYSKGGVQ